MIRKGDWKYIYFTAAAPLSFNLKDNPGEFRNLARDKRHTDIRNDSIPTQIAGLGDEFHEELVGQLGTVQSALLTDRYYRKT